MGVKITETILRDAHQSLIATRMTTEEMLPALEMLDKVCNVVNVPVIASGGAGSVEDFITLFKTLPKVDAGLAASIFHFGEVKIGELKEKLKMEGISVRI